MSIYYCQYESFLEVAWWASIGFTAGYQDLPRAALGEEEIPS